MLSSFLPLSRGALPVCLHLPLISYRFDRQKEHTIKKNGASLLGGRRLGDRCHVANLRRGNHDRRGSGQKTVGGEKVWKKVDAA